MHLSFSSEDHPASSEMSFLQQHSGHRRACKCVQSFDASSPHWCSQFPLPSATKSTSRGGERALSLQWEKVRTAKGVDAGEVGHWGLHDGLPQGARVRRDTGISWKVKRLLVLKTISLECSTSLSPRWVICKISKWISPVCEAEMPTALHKLPECFTIPLEIPVRRVLLREHMVAFFLP